MKIEKITPQIAALYLEQKCDVTWNYTDTIDGAFSKGDVWHDSPIHASHIRSLEAKEISIILHLRSIESITEQEARDLYKANTGETWEEICEGGCLVYWFNQECRDVTGIPAVWLKLLEMGFDLFGLIESGLAKEIGK